MRWIVCAAAWMTWVAASLGQTPEIVQPNVRSTFARAPIAAGTGTPSLLTLDSAVGTIQTVEFTMQERSKTWEQGKAVYDIEMPKVQVRLYVEVEAENLEAGTRSLMFRIASVSFDENAFRGEFTESGKQTARERMTRIKELTGTTGKLTQFALSDIEIGEISYADGANTEVHATQLKSILGTIATMMPPLPKEAVGVGGQWEYDSVDKLGSSSIRWPLKVTLESHEFDVIKLRAAGESYIDVTIEKLPELLEGAVNRKAERRFGVVTTSTQNVRQPLPKSATQEVRISLDADYTRAGADGNFKVETIITSTLDEDESKIVYREPELSPEETIARGALTETYISLVDDGTADGDTPRELAYGREADTAELVLISAVGEQTTGQDAKGGLLPAMRFLFDVNYDERGIVWRSKQARVEGDGMPAETVTQLQRIVNMADKQPIRHIVQEMGISSKATMLGDVEPGPNKPNLLLELTSSWMVPLPPEPVAVGATWRFSRPWIDSDTGSPLWQDGDAELIAMDEETFTIAFRASSQLALMGEAQSFAIRSPFLPVFTSVDATKFDSGVRGEVTWSRSSASPVRGELVHSQRLKTSIERFAQHAESTTLQGWRAIISGKQAEFSTKLPEKPPTPTAMDLVPLERDASRESWKELKLLKAGDEPRRDVRYTTSEDQYEVYTLTAQQRQAQGNREQDQQAVGVPMTFVFSLAYQWPAGVSSMEPDPEEPPMFNMRWTLLGGMATLSDDATDDQRKAAEQFNQLMRGLRDTSGACTLLRDGGLVFESAEPAPGTQISEENSVREIREWVSRLFQSLPREPIGKSATWTRPISVSVGGNPRDIALTTLVTRMEDDVTELNTLAMFEGTDLPLAMNVPATHTASVLRAKTMREITSRLKSEHIAPVLWSYKETTMEERAITQKSDNSLTDWLYVINEVYATAARWPDFVRGETDWQTLTPPAALPMPPLQTPAKPQ